MYLTKLKAKKILGVLFLVVPCLLGLKQIANRHSRVRKGSQEEPQPLILEKREPSVSETFRQNPQDGRRHPGNLKDVTLGRHSLQEQGVLVQPPNASVSSSRALYSDEVINRHVVNFTLVNGDACRRNASSQQGDVFLLILVKCRPGDRFPREQIRKTWGGLSQVDGQRVLTMFLVGATANSTLMGEVADESRRRGDIIQGNFRDHYLNLTHKTLMGFRWAAEFCPRAEYVASADVDVLLNLHNIVRRLRARPREGLAEGHVQAQAKPFRGNSSKWQTSRDLYPEPTYAPYFSGVCYVLSGDVAAGVYRESAHVRFLPWDDVYIGLVLQRLGVVPQKVWRYLTFRESYQEIEAALTAGPAVLVGTEKDHAWTTSRSRHNAQLVKIWRKITQEQEAKNYVKKEIV